MIRTSRLLLAAALLTLGGAARASILDFRQLVVDFTGGAVSRVTWSEPATITATAEGLGWDGEATASRAGWIQTEPLAVGLSWRPATAVGVRVLLNPAPRPLSLDNGQTSTPWKGMAFVRYSPDLVHWSTWQAMEDAEGRPGVGPGSAWAATVAVPGSEREEYAALLQEYMRLDVPWQSDEEAAVKWMLAREPRLFARHLPFVGYVQVRWEGSFHGGRRVTSLQVTASAGIGGVHLAPRDPRAAEGRDDAPWRFDGRKGAPSR